MIKIYTSALAAVLFFASCNQKSTKEFDVEKHRSHIIHLDSQYVHHIVSQNADSISSLYHTNGILLSPGEAAVKGNTSIKSWYTNAFEFGLRKIHFSPSELSGDEQNFIEIGQVEVGLQMGEADTLMYEQYKYMHVWTRLASGEYKLSRDMWNADLIQIQGE